MLARVVSGVGNCEWVVLLIFYLLIAIFRSEVYSDIKKETWYLNIRLYTSIYYYKI